MVEGVCCTGCLQRGKEHGAILEKCLPLGEMVGRQDANE